MKRKKAVRSKSHADTDEGDPEHRGGRDNWGGRKNFRDGRLDWVWKGGLFIVRPRIICLKRSLLYCLLNGKILDAARWLLSFTSSHSTDLCSRNILAKMCSIVLFRIYTISFIHANPLFSYKVFTLWGSSSILGPYLSDFTLSLSFLA